MKILKFDHAYNTNAILIYYFSWNKRFLLWWRFSL